jgi:hypothetical protein
VAVVLALGLFVAAVSPASIEARAHAAPFDADDDEEAQQQLQDSLQQMEQSEQEAQPEEQLAQRDQQPGQ